MADAVEQLSASANGQESQPSSAPKMTIPVNVAADDKEDSGKTDMPTKPALAEPQAKDTDESSGSKRVIKPLTTTNPRKTSTNCWPKKKPKRREPPRSAPVEDKPSGAPMAPPSQTDGGGPSPGPSDPSSIAL